MITLWLIATLSFFALRLAPGNPARLADPTVPAVYSETLTRLYGLDRPITAQYAEWMASLVRGDLGWSLHYRAPVSEVIGRSLAPTLLLSSLGLAFQYALALALALAACRRSRLRRGFDALTLVLYAVPTFWLGSIALYGAGRYFAWFPSSDVSTTASFDWVTELRQAALPAATLALTNLALIYRLTTDSMVRTLGSSSTLAARSRGIGEGVLLWRHATRQAAPIVVQRLSLDLPLLLSGSLVLEVLFSRPGLGRAAHQAFLARDFPVLAAVSTAAGGLVVAGSLLADLAHSALDPRVDDEA